MSSPQGNDCRKCPSNCESFLLGGLRNIRCLGSQLLHHLECIRKSHLGIDRPVEGYQGDWPVSLLVLRCNKILPDLTSQGVLPWPKFWVTTKPFGTPIGPYLLKWGMTTLMIVAPPAGDAFNFGMLAHPTLATSNHR
jgi:hypothetical protein